MLHGLSFTVPAGQVTGLLGPSGSGKTTLMRAIVGVHRSSGGHGHRARPAGRLAPTCATGSATSPRRRASTPTCPCGRTSATSPPLYGHARREADAAIADVGLADAAAQLVATSPAVSAARASLACALVAQPEVLVLDEPTVGLDPVLRVELWDRFHALAAAGTTLFVSSHVMDEAGRCDRLLLLREGELLADSTPAAAARRRRPDDLEEAFLRWSAPQQQVAA